MNLLPRPLRSIRARLTAWYALLLLTIVLLLGAGASYLLERDLREDVDRRLWQTGVDMTAQFDVAFRFGDPVVISPPPDAFSFPSQLVQVVDITGDIQFRSENLGGRRALAFQRERVRAGEPHFETTQLENVTVRTLLYPIVLNDTTIGAVIVGEPLIQLTQTLEDLRRTFVFAALAGAVLAAFGGWFLASRSLKPVDRMTETARRIVSGTRDTLPLETRLDFPRTGDEIARLGDTFNDLLDRLETALETQRRFVADASHELRTPLTAVQGNIDLLERQLDRDGASTETADETITELRRESGRMARLVADLLTLARLEPATGVGLHTAETFLAPVIEDATKTVTASHSDTKIDSMCPSALRAVIDRDRIEQVLVILLDNAARYSSPGSGVSVTALGDGDKVVIEIADKGIGIPTEDLPHVFERFYRSGSAREMARSGSGLGLSIAQAVVRAHGGTISVRSQEGLGTTVKIILPASASE